MTVDREPLSGAINVDDDVEVIATASPDGAPNSALS
jgi:hypothetical protein